MLQVWIWYPSSEPRTQTAATAVPANVPLDTAPQLPAAKDGTHPLLIFSHGWAATSTGFSALLTRVASRGFVVAAPFHQDCDLGCAANGVLGLTTGSQATLAVRRPADIESVKEAVLAASASKDPILGGLIDASRMGVAGHSLGGYASLRILEDDSRFRAGLVFAPGPSVGPYSVDPSKLTSPLMVIQGDADNNQPFAGTEDYYSKIPGTTAESWFVAIHRTAHGLGDSCSFALAVFPPCSLLLPQQSVAEIVDRWAIPFLMQYVADDASYSASLDPATNGDARSAVIETKPGGKRPVLPQAAPLSVPSPAVRPPSGPPGTTIESDALTESSGILPSTSSDPARFSVAYSSDGYGVSLGSVDQPDPSHQPKLPIEGVFADASIAVDVVMRNSFGDQYVNIACRSQDDTTQYRLFLAPDAGVFGLTRWAYGLAESLTGLRQSSAIRSHGQTNRLQLSCHGTTIDASINGVQVASVSDGMFASGQFWLGVGQEPAGVWPGSTTPAGMVIEADWTSLVLTQQ
jgi:dienelactone hydrolase